MRCGIQGRETQAHASEGQEAPMGPTWLPYEPSQAKINHSCGNGKLEFHDEILRLEKGKMYE